MLDDLGDGDESHGQEDTQDLRAIASLVLSGVMEIPSPVYIALNFRSLSP